MKFYSLKSSIKSILQRKTRMQTLIIKKYLTAIKLDEENKLLFAYDIKDNSLDEQSEGILIEVNAVIYQKIASYFQIKPEDYGVYYVGDKGIKTKIISNMK